MIASSRRGATDARGRLRLDVAISVIGALALALGTITGLLTRDRDSPNLETSASLAFAVSALLLGIALSMYLTHSWRQASGLRRSALLLLILGLLLGGHADWAFQVLGLPFIIGGLVILALASLSARAMLEGLLTSVALAAFVAAVLAGLASLDFVAEALASSFRGLIGPVVIATIARRPAADLRKPA